ncbi:hypothetical protein Gotri_012861 [Gossypium trilobum]|uniref:Uncharacterized protein n=1 Tax=Gossypium trilobum TaxID=34281 RepID=A0A7J9DS11_9ROSI|nr:hypothetical protein [Gossypium trilobum]
MAQLLEIQGMLLREVCCEINMEIRFWVSIGIWVNVRPLKLKYGTLNDIVLEDSGFTLLRRLRRIMRTESLQVFDVATTEVLEFLEQDDVSSDFR